MAARSQLIKSVKQKIHLKKLLNYMELNIEISVPKEMSPNDTGLLLEKLAAKALKAYGFNVETQVRLIASEIDLLCRHKISGERIYVECKAYREKAVTGAQLRQLLGTVQFENFSAGWLISTGPLSKDAKGFVEKWYALPENKKRTLRIYDPSQLIQLLIDTSIICDPMRLPFSNSIIANIIMSWTLLITPYGYFWIATLADMGLPKFAVVFNAYNGVGLTDKKLLEKLINTNTSLNKLEFKIAHHVLPALEIFTPLNYSSEKMLEENKYGTEVSNLLSEIKQLKDVRYFNVYSVKKFGREGVGITINIAEEGMFNAVGSNLVGAINALSGSIKFSDELFVIFTKILQILEPYNPFASVILEAVQKNIFLVWSDLYDDNLENILTVQLDKALDNNQAIRSAIIVGAELMGLRVIAKDMKIYKYHIWVEDKLGNRWTGEIDLSTPDPTVRKIKKEN